MNRSQVTRIAARVLLLAGLVGINAFPFFTNIRTSYDIIFFVLSAIHAELGLFLAWGIFVPKPQGSGRMIWCLVGSLTAFVAALRLLPGEWLTVDPRLALQVGLGMTLPAMLPIACFFAAQRYLTGTSLVLESVADHNAASFRLSHLFILTAGCAFLSFLIRQMVRSPDGWLGSYPDAGLLALTVSQSFVMGLLAAPAALVILRPNRWSFLWLIYFVAVCAADPILQPLIVTWFEGKPLGQAVHSWAWPEESYFTVVLDNLTWYGPQLLPTIVLFATLRLSGVRIQQTK